MQIHASYARRVIFFGALLLLLPAAAAPAQTADHKEGKTSIPNIADIAGIKVGYSSMDELEGQLGKGKVVVGGHPNGARLWRVKDSSWVIYADAFDYSKRGAVVDTFSITVDPSAAKDLPYAKSTGNRLAWAGIIALGIDEENLLKLLKRNSWTAVEVSDGWLVEAKGHSTLTSIECFNQWAARFTIKGKSLVGITLDARQKR